MIDGMDALTATWHYAGILGLWPAGKTLRRLTKMVEGRARQRRIESIELAQLVWGLSQIDLAPFILYGEIESTNIGGEVRLTPEQQAEVERKKAEIRAANPDHPKVIGEK